MSKITESVLLSVYNRSPLVLLNCLASIAANDLRDTEIVIADDGSTEDYGWVKQATSELPIRWISVDTCADRPKTYNLHGYNNPAYVNNCLVDAAQGENLFFVSSDVILNPKFFHRARSWNVKRYVYECRVLDMEPASEILGKTRVYPMGWARYTSRAAVLECGGFDEGFLNGIAWEDNDFSARLLNHVGHLSLDIGVTAYHQSHEKEAYSDYMVGFRRNKAYIEKKWGGRAPFSLLGAGADPIQFATMTQGCIMYVRAFFADGVGERIEEVCGAGNQVSGG